MNFLLATWGLLLKQHMVRERELIPVPKAYKHRLFSKIKFAGQLTKAQVQA